MMKNRWTLKSKQIGVVVGVHDDESLCTVLWTTRNRYLIETHVTGALMDANDLGNKDRPGPEECTSA